MKHIWEVDNLIDILNKPMTISFKTDGGFIQTSNENGIVFRQRSGSISKLGPVIDNIVRLTNGVYNDPINFLSNKKDILEKYNIVSFEFFNSFINPIAKLQFEPKNKMILHYAEKDGNPLNDFELVELSNLLDIDPPTVVWKGNLNEYQISFLTNFSDMLPEERLENDKSFYETFRMFFDINNKYIIDESEIIEGFVFNYDKGCFKIIDPQFKMIMNQHQQPKNNTLIECTVFELSRLLNNYFSDNKLLSGDIIDRLEKIFIDIINNYKINDLLEIVGHITKEKWHIVNLNLVRNNELKEKLEDDELRLLYRIFITNFYRKKRSSTQINISLLKNIVNPIIEKITK